MGVSWLFYILAVIFGVWTLMGLTGSLDRGTTSPYGWNVRLRSLLRIASFILGLGLTIGVGWWLI